MHYLENLDKAYKEVARVLKRNGTLLLIVSHPVYDSNVIMETKEDFVTVKLYDGKVEVKFPPHSIKDYFSRTFLELFDLKEVDESASVDADNPHKLPETLYIEATKR